MSPLTEISILFWEGTIKKKKKSYERRYYESVDEKSYILSYVPKKYEKNNLVLKGLIVINKRL